MLLKQYYCDVDVTHLISFNEELAHRLVTEPAEIIPLVRDTTSSDTYTVGANTSTSLKQLSNDAPIELSSPPSRSKTSTSQSTNSCYIPLLPNFRFVTSTLYTSLISSKFLELSSAHQF